MSECPERLKAAGKVQKASIYQFFRFLHLSRNTSLRQ